MEATDIGQNLWLWLLSKPRKRLHPVLNVEDQDKQKKEIDYFERNLYMAGDIMCRKEKAQVSGYRHTDEYFYSQSLIVALLEARENDGVMPTDSVSSKVRRTRSLAEGRELETMLADLDRALASLDPDQYEFLVNLYGKGMTSRDLAELNGVTRQAVEARASRLIEKMIDLLGGVSPYGV